jgi:hypothetical protein
MSGEKYIGLDVHQATISVAVVDSQGKLIMESILETKASTLLEFLAGLRGTWNSIRNLRGGDLGGMVVRFAQAACRPSAGVQSAEERVAQTGQQE